MRLAPPAGDSPACQQCKPEPSRLRVLIVDQHEVSRAAIRALLRTEGLDVLADAATASRRSHRATRPGPTSSSSTRPRSRRCARHRAARSRAPVGARRAPHLERGGRMLSSTVTRSSPRARSAPAHYASRCDQQPQPARSLTCRCRHTSTTSPPRPARPPTSSSSSPVPRAARTGRQGRADGHWLEDEYGLGRGHAMAIVATINQQTEPSVIGDEKVTTPLRAARSPAGARSTTSSSAASALRSDTDVLAGRELPEPPQGGQEVRDRAGHCRPARHRHQAQGRTAGRTARAAGSWNSMVTHRVRVRPRATWTGAARLARARLRGRMIWRRAIRPESATEYSRLHAEWGSGMAAKRLAHGRLMTSFACASSGDQLKNSTSAGRSASGCCRTLWS